MGRQVSRDLDAVFSFRNLKFLVFLLKSLFVELSYLYYSQDGERISFGWLWMVLNDFCWFWMIFGGFGCFQSTFMRFQCILYIF